MLSILTVMALSLGLQAWDGDIVLPDQSKAASLSQVVGAIPKGSVVIIGEQHDLQAHHDKQRDLVTEVIAQHSRVDLALEFFDFTQQCFLDDYLAGKVSDDEFLRAVKMKADVFAFYKPMIWLAAKSGGQVLGVNLPRSISGRIAKVGLQGLTSQELSNLPPNFELGSALYKERFIEAMGAGHGLTPNQMDNFFAAQSAWDDTMAYQSLSRAQSTLIQIVGNFHVEYKLGLPARFSKRGAAPIVFAQVNAAVMTEAELQESLKPSSRYGNLGDYVWISGEPH